MKFNHNFTASSNMDEMNGYTKALNDVFLYLKMATNNNGEIQREIDVLPLVEKISDTSADLVFIAKQIEKQLQHENI